MERFGREELVSHQILQLYLLTRETPEIRPNARFRVAVARSRHRHAVALAS